MFENEIIVVEPIYREDERIHSLLESQAIFNEGK